MLNLSFQVLPAIAASLTRASHRVCRTRNSFFVMGWDRRDGSAGASRSASTSEGPAPGRRRRTHRGYDRDKLLDLVESPQSDAVLSPAEGTYPTWKADQAGGCILCNRSLAGLRLSGFLARFDAIHMQPAPFAERCQRGIKRLAEGRKRILNARRNFLEVLSRYDAVRLHLLEMLNQHLLADSRHRTAQFSEALGVHAQCPQDEHLPFPPDHVERGLQAATIVLPLHDKGSCHTAFHPYGQVSTCRTEIKIDIRDATNERQADCTPKHLTRDP